MNIKGCLQSHSDVRITAVFSLQYNMVQQRVPQNMTTSL